MSWFNIMRRGIRPAAHREERETPRPFPSTSTMFGMAAVMFVIWLLASGLPQLLTTPDPSTPGNNIEAGPSK